MSIYELNENQLYKLREILFWDTENKLDIPEKVRKEIDTYDTPYEISKEMLVALFVLTDFCEEDFEN